MAVTLVNVQRVLLAFFLKCFCHAESLRYRDHSVGAAMKDENRHVDLVGPKDSRPRSILFLGATLIIRPNVGKAIDEMVPIDKVHLRPRVDPRFHVRNSADDGSCRDGNSSLEREIRFGAAS